MRDRLALVSKNLNACNAETPLQTTLQAAVRSDLHASAPRPRSFAKVEVENGQG